MELIQEPRWNMVIPIVSQKEEPLEAHGYIESETINCHENSCLHVAPINASYRLNNGKMYIPGYSYWDPSNPRMLNESFFINNVLWFTTGPPKSPFPYCWGAYYSFYDGRMHGFSGLKSHSTWVPDSNIAYVNDPDAVISSMGLNPYYYGKDRPTHLGTVITVPVVTKKEADNVRRLLRNEDPLEPYLSDMFFETCSALRLTSNSIANALEVVDLVKDLRSPLQTLENLGSQVKKAGGKERAADAWLKYRYVYNTTKSDISEISEKSKQLTGDLSSTLRAGSASKKSTLHLKLDYKPLDNIFMNAALSLTSGAQRFGFDPSLYNTWDMIPFSFVADWFLPIGKNLERLSNMKWAATMPYNVTALASAYCPSFTVGNITYSVYERFAYSPTFDFTFEGSDASSIHTWIKRGVDTVALL